MLRSRLEVARVERAARVTEKVTSRVRLDFWDSRAYDELAACASVLVEESSSSVAHFARDKVERTHPLGDSVFFFVLQLVAINYFWVMLSTSLQLAATTCFGRSILLAMRADLCPAKAARFGAFVGGFMLESRQKHTVLSGGRICARLTQTRIDRRLRVACIRQRFRPRRVPNAPETTFVYNQCIHLYN